MTTSKVATTATKFVCETPKKKKISKKQFNFRNNLNIFR